MQNAFKFILYIAAAALCIGVAVAVYGTDDGAAGGANVGLIATYVLSGIAIAGAIIFPIVYLIQHPKQLVRAAIGLGIVAVLYLVSWAISGNEITIAYEKVSFTSASMSKIIGGGLIMMYIMIAGVLVVTIASEVKNILK